jgi:4-amino-4-deoxy-L-arabinose transferase-like glycosyltransferase
MSDFAMLACLVWAMVLLNRYFSLGRGAYLVCSILLFAVSSLFKSYAAIFSLLLIFGICSGFWSSRKRIALGILALVLSVLPVLFWHWFAFIQAGQQEIWSHALELKLAALVSVELYKEIFQNLFRFLGYLPGGLLLAALLARLIPSKKTRLNLKPAWWIGPWIGVGLLYLIFTSDKLIDHDYYFLLIAPPVIVLSAQIINEVLRLLNINWGGKTVFGFLLILLISNFAFAGKKLVKAQKENPDVIQCSDEVKDAVAPDQLIATLTDLGRYNSIAYYAQRRSINVSGDAFKLQDYAKAGAKYLVLNLSPQEYLSHSKWLEANQATSPIVSQDLRDFKGRKRLCRIYSLGLGMRGLKS